jgi:predicted GH43/DUF377 family glycosyl hydrolase
MWVKKGLIIKPHKNLYWMQSHAMCPVVKKIEGSFYRIYFSGRNKKNRSQIGYVEIDMEEPERIQFITPEPVLKLGSLGAFDDSGVFPFSIVEVGDKVYLYYGGWNAGVTVPFYSFVNIAVSENGGKTFERMADFPLIGYNEIDPYLVASCWILREERIWRMWYTSGVKWVMENNRPKHYYHIKYAESIDGINWERRGIVCIDFKNKDEYAITRPCVYKKKNIYKMWYSYRGEKYRIGYAESEDGIKWTRMDERAGIDVSPTGWDSEMIEYACVFVYKNKEYMFYNGNNYGETGIGYAVWEEEK